MTWTVELIEHPDDRWEDRIAVTFPTGECKQVYRASGHGIVLMRWLENVNRCGE